RAHPRPVGRDGRDRFVGRRGTAMTGWADLERELDAWAAAGRCATLWWRDDDAVEASDVLDRLLELATTVAARPLPVALAVIPMRASAGLARRLEETPATGVLLHGFAHVNHAPPGDKKAEFGAHRPPEPMLAEITAGRDRLTDLFGKRALPVLVPPWNRVASGIVNRLGEARVTGLSTYGPRAARHPAPGMTQVNTHIDVIDWHSGRGFVGASIALHLAVGHLAQRRQRSVDPDEPTGLLTHHLVHDPETSAFLATFFARTAAHPAAVWLAAADVFVQGPGTTPGAARPA
ncbi:MAG: polysaccharide deacetylase family protein, partial [Dongiaceae bacterium]